MSMAAAAVGGELKIPSVSVLPEDGMAADGPAAGVKRRLRPGRKPNGVVRGDTKSLYISPSKSLAFSRSVVSRFPMLVLLFLRARSCIEVLEAAKAKYCACV